MKYEIGTEVAYDMNCYCGDLDCDNGDQGYILMVIDGTETESELERCTIFGEKTMKKLK